VRAIAESLLAGGPVAQAAAMALIGGLVHRAVDDTVIEETAQTIAHLRATPEAREGIAAFLEKRKPGWLEL